MKEQEVKTLLQEKGLKWDDFYKFMINKTYSVDDDGTKIYPKSNVLSFINKMQPTQNKA